MCGNLNSFFSRHFRDFHYGCSVGVVSGNFFFAPALADYWSKQNLAEDTPNETSKANSEIKTETKISDQDDLTKGT